MKYSPVLNIESYHCSAAGLFTFPRQQKCLCVVIWGCSSDVKIKQNAGDGKQSLHISQCRNYIVCAVTSQITSPGTAGDDALFENSFRWGLTVSLSLSSHVVWVHFKQSF